MATIIGLLIGVFFGFILGVLVMACIKIDEEDLK